MIRIGARVQFGRSGSVPARKLLGRFGTREATLQMGAGSARRVGDVLQAPEVFVAFRARIGCGAGSDSRDRCGDTFPFARMNKVEDPGKVMECRGSHSCSLSHAYSLLLSPVMERKRPLT